MPLWILGALKWCLTNWKLVVVVIAITALTSYIGWLRWDNQHLKKENVTLTLQIKAVNKENKELADEAADITRKYEHTLENKWAVDKKLADSNAERIKLDKITKSISLPVIAVQLFNNTDGPNSLSAITKAVTGDVGKSNPAKEPGVAVAAPDAPSGKSLNDLLAVANENRKNHLKCVAQVEEWQKFWSDYEDVVLKVQTDNAPKEN